MDIRFVSSLTADDENRIAPVLLSMAAALLDGLPLAYTLRLDTVAGRSFEHVHTPGVRSGEPTDGGVAVDRGVRLAGIERGDGRG